MPYVVNVKTGQMIWQPTEAKCIALVESYYKKGQYHFDRIPELCDNESEVYDHEPPF